MGVNYSALIYSLNFDQWARPVTFLTAAAGTYDLRGIYHSDYLIVPAENGSTYSDQQRTLDILEAEFAVLPVQGDHVFIWQDGPQGMPEVGEFEITNTFDNGGGETTLELKKWEGVPTMALIGPVASIEAPDKADFSGDVMR